jgi:hypothetical protein
MWASDPWGDPSIAWIVICKNAKAHPQTNMMIGHKIPLRETDAVQALPVSGPFIVRCDECGEAYSYEPSDVLRFAMQLPQSFKPHPRFV